MGQKTDTKSQSRFLHLTTHYIQLEKNDKRDACGSRFTGSPYHATDFILHCWVLLLCWEWNDWLVGIAIMMGEQGQGGPRHTRGACSDHQVETGGETIDSDHI